VGELEDERQETRLSALRASYSDDGHSGAYSCTRSYRQIDLDVLYKIRLLISMIRLGDDVNEAATRADVIKLFPTTAYSVWQDSL
jgi:hypothetical protein